MFYMYLISVLSLLFQSNNKIGWASNPYIPINIDQDICVNFSDWKYRAEIAARKWCIEAKVDIRREKSSPDGDGCTKWTNFPDGINVLCYNDELQTHDLIVPHLGDEFLLPLGECKIKVKTSGEISEADIVINQRAIKFIKNNTIKLDQILLHEFGHFLGLQHNADSTSIMYWRYTGKGVITYKDKLDLIEIYGKEGIFH